MGEKSCAGLGFLVAMIAILFLFLVAGQRDTLKQEAVEHGYAEWIVTGQNKTEFKWKEKQ
jgi:hypothetical protein